MVPSDSLSFPVGADNERCHKKKPTCQVMVMDLYSDNWASQLRIWSLKVSFHSGLKPLSSMSLVSQRCTFLSAPVIQKRFRSVALSKIGPLLPLRTALCSPTQQIQLPLERSRYEANEALSSSVEPDQALLFLIHVGTTARSQSCLGRKCPFRERQQLFDLGSDLT